MSEIIHELDEFVRQVDPRRLKLITRSRENKKEQISYFEIVEHGLSH